MPAVVDAKPPCGIRRIRLRARIDHLVFQPHIDAQRQNGLLQIASHLRPGRVLVGDERPGKAAQVILRRGILQSDLGIGIRPHASRARSLFEHDGIESALRQHVGAGDARDAGSDDGDTGTH